MFFRKSLVLLSFIAIAGCYSSPSSPSSHTIAAGSTTVLLPSGAALNGTGPGFAPSSLTVAAGTTVTWGNNDVYQHSTTSDTGLWDATIGPGQTFTFTFPTPGTYTYHDKIYTQDKGTIIVQ